MNTVRFRIIAWVSISFLLALEGLGWGQMITNAGERNNADFIIFYTAGTLAKEHGFSQVYDVGLQQGIEQDVLGVRLSAGRVLIYNHMPYLIPILDYIVDANYTASFIRWTLLLIAIYIPVIIVLIRLFFAEVEKNLQVIMGFGVLTFFPLFVSLWQGQDTAFLFLGMGLWCIGVLRKQNWITAVGLVLTTVRPHISIVLALPFLLDQRGTWWRFVFLTSILAIISLMLIGWQGTLKFLHVLQISTDPKFFAINPAAMLNLYGIVVRSANSFSADSWSFIAWIIYFSGILGAILLWRYWKTSKEFLLGLLILLALLTAPHLYYHDLTPLILPLLFFLKPKMDSGASPMWILVLMGTSFFLLAGFIFTPLQFVVPYILMAALAWIFFSKTDWFSKTTVQ